MVYVTGDCHGNYRKFSTDSFPEQEDMTRDDFVIVCGDFGIWNNTKSEKWWLDWLSEKSFTLLFVDGNHENFDRLYSDEFEVVDFHGGKAHKIRENVFHLMRGYVFELCGKKFFSFGGASSHDIDDGILDPADFESEHEFRRAAALWDLTGKMFRINHMSWWEQELPSKEEMDFGLDTLEAHNNKVDFVVSHCAPQEAASIFSMGGYQPDILTSYFDMVANTIEFKKWFFGHYHDNMNILEKYVLLYEQIIRVV